MPPDADPVCFHLGVVAPRGFAVPELGPKAWRRLYPLLGPRLSRRERISLVTVGGEPISRELSDVWRGKGWPGHSVGGNNHRKACAHLSALVDALAVLHTGPLGGDMRALLAWCDWLGVQHRTVQLVADGAEMMC